MTTIGATHPHELVDNFAIALTREEYLRVRDSEPIHVVASERTRHADD